VQILRFPSLAEPQFFGCATAFVDALTAELNAAALSLRKLEGQTKGAAFAFEIALDAHRYGALMVLDRWAALVHAYGPHLRLSRYQNVIEETPARVQTAENLLGRANQLLDATERYSGEVVEACLLSWRSLDTTFAEERAAAEQMLKLGPMLPDEFQQARRVFAQDLAAR
jgi:hypothetical protein